MYGKFHFNTIEENNLVKEYLKLLKLKPLEESDKDEE